MGRLTDTGWVEPPQPIGGLDHLGVQAPCVALYTQLLPGITNVTDRARYYSFYPWLIRSFEQRYRDHSIASFCRVLRRAECVFALSAMRHARFVADGDEGRHGAGMVGRQSFRRILETSNTIDLDAHAAFEGSDRYFQNKLGGFGQYYFGPLRDLRILDTAPEGTRGVPRYDSARGSGLADAFGAGMPQDDFFRVLEKSKIRWTDLDDLSEFCPCSLQRREAERGALLDVFLVRSEAYRSAEAANRRASLLLALDLLAHVSRLPEYAPESVFRAATYTKALPDGSPWTVDPSLQVAQRGWGTYQQNELLAVALQAIFVAVLAEIELRHSGRIESSAHAGVVCAGLLPTTARFRRRRIADLVSELKSDLPPLHDWQDKAHEMQRMWNILTAGEGEAEPTELVGEAVRVLLSLLARGVDEDPYREFDFDPDYFGAREIHLQSFGSAWRSTWANLTVEEWVQWISVRWGIQRHLCVALRKLRGQERDTFRIRPLEHELRVIEVPRPTATAPRLAKVFQILRDLDLTDLDSERWPGLTRRGREEKAAARA